MKKKNLKRKLKLSSIAALTSASILTNVPDDIDELISGEQQETPHVAYANEEQAQGKTKLSFPYILKSVLMLPLWLVGSMLLKLLEPLKNFGLSFLFTFLFLCLIVIIIAKLLFPNLKIKDILSPKNLLIIAIFSLLINLARVVLPLINKDYLKYSVLLYLALGLCCLVIVLLPLIKLSKRINKLYQKVAAIR